MSLGVVAATVVAGCLALVVLTVMTLKTTDKDPHRMTVRDGINIGCGVWLVFFVIAPIVVAVLWLLGVGTLLGLGAFQP